MVAKTGIAALGDYVTAGTPRAKVNRLLALIPTVDTSPAQAGGGFLDQMSPAAATQLVVEIEALAANVPNV